MNLQELGELIEMTLIIRERPKIIKERRWYVSHEHVEVLGQGGFLTSPCGNGDTIQDALEDYVSQLRGNTLVTDAWSVNRREYQVPESLDI